MSRDDADGAEGHVAFTPLQGQYLAFICASTLVNGRPPSEAEIQRFFGVTAPTVHQMILTLERRKLLERSPGRARSLRVLLSPAALPLLQEPSRRERER